MLFVCFLSGGKCVLRIESVSGIAPPWYLKCSQQLTHLSQKQINTNLRLSPNRFLTALFISQTLTCLQRKKKSCRQVDRIYFPPRPNEWTRSAECGEIREAAGRGHIPANQRGRWNEEAELHSSENQERLREALPDTRLTGTPLNHSARDMDTYRKYSSPGELDYGNGLCNIEQMLDKAIVFFFFSLLQPTETWLRP